MENLKDLFSGLGKTLASWFEALHFKSAGEGLGPLLKPDAVMHSVWFPLVTVVLVVFFFLKKENQVAAVILMAVGAMYIYYFLVPDIEGSLSGVGVFGGVTLVLAVTAIYFFFIRGD